MTLTCGIGAFERPLRVLLIGAHADDVEIGSGGTVLSLLRRSQPVEVTGLVLAAGGARGEEATSSADSFLAGAAKRFVLTHAFQEGFPLMTRRSRMSSRDSQRPQTPTSSSHTVATIGTRMQVSS